jgi:hypothetical protein
MTAARPKYEWHAIIVVSWLLPGLVALSLLAPRPEGAAAGASVFNLIINVAIVGILVRSALRLDKLVEGRANMRLPTIMSLVVGITAGCVLLYSDLRAF